MSDVKDTYVKNMYNLSLIIALCNIWDVAVGSAIADSLKFLVKSNGVTECLQLNIAVEKCVRFGQMSNFYNQ